MADPKIQIRAVVKDEVSPGMKKMQGNVSRSTGAMQSSANKLTTAVKGLAGAYIGLAGLRMVGSFLSKSTELAKIQMQAESDLTSALVAKNKAYGALLPEMKRYASSLQEQVRFGDEEILSLQAVGLNLGISTDKIKDATKAAIGLTSKGIELKSAMLLIGKAAAGDTTALSRYGIKLDEGLSKQEKFNEVLRLGAEGFSVVAEASENATSQIEKQQMAIADQQEMIGMKLIPTQLAWNEVKLVGINLMLKALNIRSREEMAEEVSIKNIERLNKEVIDYDEEIQKLEKDLVKAKAGFEGFDPFSQRVIDAPDIIRHKINVLLAQMKDANIQADELSSKDFKLSTMKDFEPADKDKDDPLIALNEKRKQSFKELSVSEWAFGDMRVQTWTEMQSKIKALNEKEMEQAKLDAQTQKELQISIGKSAMSNALQVTAMFKDNNKGMFALNKGLAMANVTINTIEGVSNALALKAPPPLPQIYAGILGALGMAQMAKLTAVEYKAALGADFITSGPTRMLVGDNPGGRERVQVTPMSSQNVNGPQGGTVNADMSVIINGDASLETVAAIAENQEQKLFDLKTMLEELNFRGQGVAVA